MFFLVVVAIIKGCLSKHTKKGCDAVYNYEIETLGRFSGFVFVLGSTTTMCNSRSSGSLEVKGR